MTHRRSGTPTCRRSRGISIIELMVGIAAGMLIVAAMSLLFANNSRGRAETERASLKIENGRYAMELLATDLEHAGYFAGFDPQQLTLPTAKPDPCSTDVNTIKAALGVHVQGYDDNATGLGCISDVRPGTDVVVIRRVSTCVAGVGTCPALAGMVAFQASSCSDSSHPELSTTDVNNHYRFSRTTGDFTLHRRNCTGIADIQKFVLRIYFVANNDKAGDGIPTLKRAELGVSGGSLAFSTTSLVQGVDNLQVEYGMDTNADGNPDAYSASPDIYQTCAPGACVGYWASVVSAKLFVLTRNLEPSVGYTDTKTYQLGRVANAANGSGAIKTVPAFNDNYKRSVFQELVRLQNPSSRRLSPS